jgi:hypothetical protein
MRCIARTPVIACCAIGMSLISTPPLTAQDSLNSARTHPLVSLRNPELAGALSLFAPGLGHVYAGETVKGIVLAGLFVSSIGAVIAADIGDTHDSVKPGGWAAVTLLGGVYLYSLIDAPFAASRMNESSHAGSVLTMPVGSSVLTFRAGMQPLGVFASLSMRL